MAREMHATGEVIAAARLGGVGEVTSAMQGRTPTKASLWQNAGRGDRTPSGLGVGG